MHFTKSARFVFLVLALLVLLGSFTALVAQTRNHVSPMIKVGPQAIPATAASPNYGLFSCQVVNLSPNTTCYDPYQMRHAYNVDALIAAGFDGLTHSSPRTSCWS